MASTTPRKCLLQQAIDSERVDLVGINQVKFRSFGRPVTGAPPVSLGVRGLSACSVIILASDHAAIAAHIGPNEPGASANDPQSYLRLANNKMSELEDLYRKNRQYFGSDSHAYVIFATFASRPTSPEQTAIYRDRLRGLGVPIVSDSAYERSPQSIIDNDRPEGTVLVVKRQETRPTVYLEDRIVVPDAKLMPSRHVATNAPQTSSSAVASSSRAVPQTSDQQSAEPYWAIRKGSKEYMLLNKSGSLLQSTLSPPKGVRICLFDRSGAISKAVIFDGKNWKPA